MVPHTGRNRARKLAMCGRTRIGARPVVTLPLMKRLSIKEVAFEAAWKCWGLRRELLSVMIIPIAALLAIGIGAATLDMTGIVAGYVHLACYFVVSSLAAISCHRVLLLGPVSVPKFGVGQLGARELTFIATLLFMCFGLGLLQFIGDAATRSLSGIGDDEGERRSFTLYILGSLPAWYLFSRLALMLPSIAIETRVRIAEAWQLSRGNGARLVILIVFLPWLVRWLEWGIAMVVPGDAAQSIASTTLYAVFLPLEIALLSVSYRRLIE